MSNCVPTFFGPKPGSGSSASDHLEGRGFRIRGRPCESVAAPDNRTTFNRADPLPDWAGRVRPASPVSHFMKTTGTQGLAAGTISPATAKQTTGPYLVERARAERPASVFSLIGAEAGTHFSGASFHPESIRASSCGARPGSAQNRTSAKLWRPSCFSSLRWQIRRRREAYRRKYRIKAPSQGFLIGHETFHVVPIVLNLNQAGQFLSHCR